MKLLTAFFRLIRWPNLIFIVITQLLFYFCVYTSLLKDKPEQQVSLLFFLLIFSSICIAAAGYIINDYFDIQIDAINKPNRLIINKFIKRRWAIVWHWILSALGVLVSIYISYKIKVWPIAIINLLCVFVLWFYSTTFKKK
jgi:4-hydroxybenzoate polyprenyltransferase